MITIMINDWQSHYLFPLSASAFDLSVSQFLRHQANCQYHRPTSSWGTDPWQNIGCSHINSLANVRSFSGPTRPLFLWFESYRLSMYVRIQLATCGWDFRVRSHNTLTLKLSTIRLLKDSIYSKLLSPTRQSIRLRVQR